MSKSARKIDFRDIWYLPRLAFLMENMTAKPKKSPRKRAPLTDGHKNERGLTGPQQMFCYEYLKDWNGRAAAVRAGYNHRAAEQLMRNPRVAAEINRIRELFMNRYEGNLDCYLKILWAHVTADLSKVARWNEQEGLVPKDSKDLPWTDSIAIESISVRETKDGRKLFSMKKQNSNQAMAILEGFWGLKNGKKPLVDVISRADPQVAVPFMQYATEQQLIPGPKSRETEIDQARKEEAEREGEKVLNAPSCGHDSPHLEPDH